MNQHKLSIIIPVFNTGDSAVRLVLAILKGRYKNLEFILVDDGSTDDSLKLMKEFVREFRISQKKAADKLRIRAEKAGKRPRIVVPTIKILHEENLGPGAARNFGLDNATGQFIFFLDSDDTVDKTFVEKLHAAITKYDGLSSSGLTAALALCGYCYHRVKQDQTHDVYTSALPARQPEELQKSYILRLLLKDSRLYAILNKIFRADIIDRFHLRFDEKISFAEDTKFVLQYLEAAEKTGLSRIECVEEPLYTYNYGTSTSVVASTSLSWSNWQKSFDFLKKWVGKDPSKTDQKLLRRIYRRWRLSHALAVARSNQSFGHKCNHVSFFVLIPALIVVKFRK